MSYQTTAKALDETIAKKNEIRSIIEDLKFSGVSMALQLKLYIKNRSVNDVQSELILSHRNDLREEPKVMAGMDMVILGLRKYYTGVADRLEAEEARLRNVLAGEVRP